MGQFFTYCWQHSEVLRYRDGEPIVFAYGSQFTRRGVGQGDEVFIVSLHCGCVHLLGKMRVRAITKSADDCRSYAGVDPEPAAEYLVAEAYTPARLTPLPHDLARSLRFLRGKKQVGLVFRDELRVDHQSLRSVRRLCAESAEVLANLLPALEQHQPGENTEPPQALQLTAGCLQLTLPFI
jgi:hypothetical protein